MAASLPDLGPAVPGQAVRSMTPTARWEDEALIRLSAARDQLDLVVGGHVAAEEAHVAAIAGLVAAGALRLRWAAACRAEAA